ncbi:zinc-binding protein A33-like [Sardina pilchardus]|uniref:zinc-binding protein A33-like n=1 Tax=Sardina pilchardus TaxID=27697 RepID=UPI002E100A08
MKDIVQYTPVTLDPNTANPQLTISEDLTSIGFREETQKLPDIPERFDEYTIVLGSKSFNSGTHCWDVEVGDTAGWVLGVMTESSQRKGSGFARSGVWAIGYGGGKYTAYSPSEKEIVLRVNWKPKKIRVKLDWDEREVLFCDPDDNHSLHIFTSRHSFTEPLIPLFSSPSRIVPLETYVALEELESVDGQQYAKSRYAGTSKRGKKYTRW